MSESKKDLAFGKKNYTIMVAGIVIIALGFILMGMDSTPHGFGFLGLTAGPITVMAGFILEFYAIFSKKGETTEEEL
ncbi:DUF3098 domain-containing protein [Limibacter armeniacum]|uniref:DUF3098 domain-containing protein n=1 Tax=Limibacter armeniacum TaxID=466084 RepID=UPI002FE61BA8